MNRIVQEFMTRHPRANVRLQYQHPHGVYDLVENDQVDLGLVSYPKSSRNIKAIRWREEPMVLVCAPQHRLAGQAAVRLEELEDQAMVSFDSDLEIRREIDRALTAARVETNVVMEFDNIETIKRAIEIDAGVSLLPRPTVEREVEAGSLKALPLAGVSLVRPVGIVVRRAKQLGKTARRFMQILQSETTSSAPLAAAAASDESFGKSKYAFDSETETADDPEDRGLAVSGAANRGASAQA
jgi:DNA-binding transcriptional LysR family regulator